MDGNDIASIGQGACALLVIAILTSYYLRLRAPSSVSSAPQRKWGAAALEDHPYYKRIDEARQLLPQDSPAAAEREERERARLRAHDPHRWRIAPQRFERDLHASNELVQGAEEGGKGSFDGGETPTLFDWSNAERQLLCLCREHGMSVQMPPLAFTDEHARSAAATSGKAYYFSTRAFERALLYGTLELKSTSGREGCVTIDLNSDKSGESDGSPKSTLAVLFPGEGGDWSLGESYMAS